MELDNLIRVIGDYQPSFEAGLMRVFNDLGVNDDGFSDDDIDSMEHVAVVSGAALAAAARRRSLRSHGVRPQNVETFERTTAWQSVRDNDVKIYVNVVQYQLRVSMSFKPNTKELKINLDSATTSFHRVYTGQVLDRYDDITTNLSRIATDVIHCVVAHVKDVFQQGQPPPRPPH